MGPALDDLAMQRSAPAVISCLLSLFLQGCTCRAFWPQFTNALFDSPGDGVCRITVRNGHLLRYSAPVHPQDVPPKVREMMDKLGEGGRTAYVAREWGPDGPGYRWDRLVRPDPDGRDERRSWLLNDDGQVMERSYEIPPAQAPAKVLTAASGWWNPAPTAAGRSGIGSSAPRSPRASDLERVTWSR
jgi:hypothetical protein